MPLGLLPDDGLTQRGAGSVLSGIRTLGAGLGVAARLDEGHDV
jgi:hypothetical protein